MAFEKGDTCFKPTEKPSNTYFTGNTIGDWKIGNRIAGGELYEAKCNGPRKCKTIMSFSSVSGATFLLCNCMGRNGQQPRSTKP